MKKLNDIRLVRFYLWVGLCYFFLGLLNTINTHPGQFFPVILNNFWAVVYVIILNFIFFEYSIPFVLRKRKWIVINFLLGILLIFLHLMLYSYGSYLWRLMGIGSGVYTPLRKYASFKLLIENQMAYSTGSV